MYPYDTQKLEDSHSCGLLLPKTPAFEMACKEEFKTVQVTAIAFWGNFLTMSANPRPPPPPHPNLWMGLVLKGLGLWLCSAYCILPERVLMKMSLVFR